VLNHKGLNISGQVTSNVGNYFITLKN